MVVGSRDELLGELLVDRSLDEKTTCGSAVLAGVIEGSPHCPLDRRVHISVWEDYERVLAAQFRSHRPDVITG